MPDVSDKQIEEKLAQKYNQKIIDSLKAKRKVSLILSFLFILSAVGIAVAQFWMIAFCLLILGLICVTQYLDANGNIQEVRRRSTRTLVRDFSVLEPSEKNMPSKSQPAT